MTERANYQGLGHERRTRCFRGRRSGLVLVLFLVLSAWGCGSTEEEPTVEDRGQPPGTGEDAGAVTGDIPGTDGILPDVPVGPGDVGGADDGPADAADAADVSCPPEPPECSGQLGVCAGSTAPEHLCVAGIYEDCDDATYAGHSSAYQGVDEYICDGLDNDCDGEVDEDLEGCDCGDGSCAAEAGESLHTCPADCAVCGDGECSAGEDPEACAEDCCGACGDGRCDGSACGEGAGACPADCGAGCGDGSCDPPESPLSCDADCPLGRCGNLLCEGDESPETCPMDCCLAASGALNERGDGTCAGVRCGETPETVPEDCEGSCGNGICEEGEAVGGCPADCGAYCGNCVCEGLLGETPLTCPVDCGRCGDGVVSRCPRAGETCESCPEDYAAIPDDDCDGVDDNCDGAADEGNCDDGDPCTADTCDAASSECTFDPAAADGAPCDDGDPCTDPDTCAAGECTSGPPAGCDDGDACTVDTCEAETGCKHEPMEGGCDDGDLCTVDSCDSETGCVHEPDTERCDDHEVCTDDGCDATTGCTHTPNELACDDGDACTDEDRCSDGTCSSGIALDCDDQNECTHDTCSRESGCVHTDIARRCEDGDACTTGDACSGGVCRPGPPLACDDGNPCTDDSCDPEVGCTFTANEEPCDDRNPCTTEERCSGGECAGDGAMDCDDGNPCTDDSCHALTGCRHLPNLEACDDRDACTGSDRCAAGLCAGRPLSCDDGNPCTDDTCDTASGCLHADNVRPCEDGSACTRGDACEGSACKPGAPVVCPPTDEPCAVASCVSTGASTHACLAVRDVAGSPCDDGNPCTENDTCGGDGACGGDVIQGCCGEADPTCDDGNPCTVDSCDAVEGCLHERRDDGAPCADDTVCDGTETCEAGSCTAGEPISCDDANPCTDDTCDPATGCSFAPNGGGSAPVPCEDGDACTEGESCSAGICGQGSPVDCTDGEICTDDGCDPATGCVHTPNDLECDDGDVCTGDDRCADGSCAGGATLDCDDLNACTDDACDADSGCTHSPNEAACDDGDACTTSDACSEGECLSGEPADCEDQNECTDDYCDPAVGCVNAEREGPCDDGDACTEGDRCEAGACVPGASLGCDDKNPCTEDACDSEGGCTHAVRAGDCEDGDACTEGDVCEEGVCKPGPPVDCGSSEQPCVVSVCVTVGEGAHECRAERAEEGSPCDDGNTCTEQDVCAADGGCAGAPVPDCCPAEDPTCDDGNPCTADRCDANDGCLHDPRADGDACPDGDVCNGAELCEGGACVAGAALDCDDGNHCTDDLCLPELGCRHEPNREPCDDDDACTDGDTCAGGECAPGTALACDDGNPCTDDACDPGEGCVSTDNDAPCDDGDACTEDDTCEGGDCSAGPDRDCDDSNPCTEDACVPERGCTNTAVEGACDDGNACTEGDTCSSGSCAPGAPLDCDDSNDCTEDSCDASSGCVNAPNAKRCDDGDLCTSQDTCAGGACEGGPAKDCDDGNACTDDYCVPDSGCVNVANDADCDDGNACTTKDRCAEGRCRGAAPPECDDGNPCTDDLCLPAAGCSTTPNAAACDDGDACTEGDVCARGACQGGPEIDCDDQFPCTLDSCDPLIGCTHAPTSAPCDDGDACTTGDRCSGGRCTGGPPRKCDDQNPCTDDACEPARGCTTTDNELPCSDGDLCTTTDVCSAGECAGSGDVDCDDGNPCTDDGCDPQRGCTHLPNNEPCDDGDECTVEDSCRASSCGGRARFCDDGNPCTDDECRSPSGCVHTNNARSCEDGSGCTVGDSCEEGECVGGVPVFCGETRDGCIQGVCVSTGLDTHQCVLGPAPAGVGCDDGNPCTLSDECSGDGLCVGNPVPGCCPEPDPSCDDQNPCTADRCDMTEGCVHEDHPDGTSCADGNLCDGAETCESGSCTAGESLTCDDGDPCTGDSCEPSAGCLHVPIANIECDDDNVCTEQDRCSGGRCRGTTYLDCDDGEVCTNDRCDAVTGCVNTPNDLRCSDGDACTVGDRCEGGECVSGGDVECDDGNACTRDTCNPWIGCTNLPESGDCDDGNPCTDGDTCVTGSCLPGPPLDCDDGEVCTDDRCDPAAAGEGAGGCSHTANTSPCDDGDPCTLRDRCSDSDCLPGEARVCDDGNPCTDDDCDPAEGCGHEPNSEPCSDGDGCTTGDRCAGGGCAAGSRVECPDTGDLCVVNVCVATGEQSHVCNARPAPAGRPCDDGNACTEQDRCREAGTCVGSPVADCCPAPDPTCDDSNPCTTDSCDPTEGCRHSPRAEGAPCPDGDLCNGEEVCEGGECKPGSALDCADDNPCTVDTCAGDRGCEHAPAEGDCEDGDPCTSGDRCVSGRCRGGGPTACNDSNPCTDDACVPGSGCSYTPNEALCDDGDACTMVDECSDGSCEGSGARDCDDGDVCTDDACDADTGCVSTHNDEACEDGDACTIGDRCSGGRCRPGRERFFERVYATPEDDELSAVVALDDGFLLAGNTGLWDDRKGWVTRTDEVGNVLWQRTFPDGAQNRIEAAVASADGFALAGHIVSGSGTSDRDAWVVRTDLLGNVVWKKSVGGSYDESATALVVSGGDLVVVGWAEGPGGVTRRAKVFRLDGAGALLWQREHGGDGQSAFQDVVAAAGGFMAAGYTTSQADGSLDAWGAFLSEDGTLLGERSHGTAKHEIVYAVAEIEGGFVFAGSASNADYSVGDLLVLRVDAVGGLVWAREIRGAQNTLATDVVVTGDGIVVAGTKHTWRGGADALPRGGGLLAMLDGAGRRLWERTYAEGRRAYALGLVALEDGFAVAGTRASDWDLDLVGVLARTDRWGHLSCVASGDCDELTVADCDDSNVCTGESCEGVVGCLNPPVQEPCEDGDSCTVGDSCAAGRCVAGPVLDCDDGLDCTEDACDPEVGCVHTPDDSVCDDGVVCTEDDCELQIGCVNAPDHGQCDDGVECTEDACFRGLGCNNLPKDSACDDGIACTVDRCDFADGCGHEADDRLCDDDEACTADSCSVEEGGCIYDKAEPDTPCDDEDPCTRPGTCSTEGRCETTFDTKLPGCYPGHSCLNPKEVPDVVPYGYMLQGWRGGSGNNFSAQACPVVPFFAETGKRKDGSSANDWVFHLVATADGTYQYKLNDDQQTEGDLAFYVLAGACGSEEEVSCIGYAEVVQGDRQVMTERLRAGEERYIIVDGTASPPLEDNICGFQMSFDYLGAVEFECDDDADNDDDGLYDCQDPDCSLDCAIPGESCVNAITVQLGTTTGDTSQYANTYDGGCGVPSNPSTMGDDTVYSFTAGPAGIYRFSLTDTSLWSTSQVVLWVGDDCPPAHGACLGARLGDKQNPAVEEIPMLAGQQVYVAVDRVDSWASGSFELDIELLDTLESDCGDGADDDGDGLTDCEDVRDCAAVGPCPGRCGSGILIESVPFALDATTYGREDLVSAATNRCTGPSGPYRAVGQRSPDMVFEMRPPHTGRYRFAVTGSNTEPALILSRGSCDLDDHSVSCMAVGADLPTTTRDIEMKALLAGGETIFVTVDTTGDMLVTAQSFRLEIDEEKESDCTNGADDDRDGLADCADPNCAAEPTCAPRLVLNEVDYDQDGPDEAEYVEIFNAGTSAYDLSGHTLEILSGAAGEVAATFDLSLAGAGLGPRGFLVVGSASILAALPDGTLGLDLGGDGAISNDIGGARILDGAAVVDAVGWEGATAEGSALLAVDNGDGALGRCPDGADSDDNGADFSLLAESTPGAANRCAQPACSEPCDDGDPCTLDDACGQGGAGPCAGTRRSCDDSNGCTVDTCDPALGCVHRFDDSHCDDGDPCTDDLCVANLGCRHTPNEEPCDDGDICTTVDLCAEGSCTGSVPLICNDGNPCTADSCDPSTGCVHVDDAANICDDGDPCTGETCDATEGCSNPPQYGPCDDDNPCTTDDACDPCIGVSFAADGAVVEYGEPWATGEDGVNFFFVADHEYFYFAWSGVDHEDGDLHVAISVPGDGASADPLHGVAFDGRTWTFSVTLSGPDEICYTPFDTPTEPQCTAPSAWPNYAGWSDNLNTELAIPRGYLGSLARGDGSFEVMSWVTNNDGTEVRSAAPPANPTGAAPQTVTATATLAYDQCTGFACLPGPPKDCDDQNPCTDDSCAEDGSCVQTPHTRACNDGDPCTDNDTCNGAGVCVGVPSCAPALKINEVDNNTPGTDYDEFIEIYNPGSTPFSLTECVLELVDGLHGATYATVDLVPAGNELPGKAFLVVGSQTLLDTVDTGALEVPFAKTSNNVQNGHDGIRIVCSGVQQDAVAYEGPAQGEGDPVDFDDTGEGAFGRCPDGHDTDDNIADFIELDDVTPGVANACP